MYNEGNIEEITIAVQFIFASMLYCLAEVVA